MSFVINLTDCSSGSKICGATLGNGSCYSESNGVYTFASCEQLAACAGNKYASVTVTPSTNIPYTGGSRTFGVYYYGLSSASNATKSGSWSGSVSCPASTCPNLVQVTLSAGANSSTSSKTYTLSFSGTSASITQNGKPAETATVTLYFEADFTTSYPYDIDVSWGCSLNVSGAWPCGNIATDNFTLYYGGGTVYRTIEWECQGMTVGDSFYISTSNVSCDQSCNSDDIQIPEQSITVPSGGGRISLGAGSFRVCD